MRMSSRRKEPYIRTPSFAYTLASLTWLSIKTLIVFVVSSAANMQI